MSLDNCDQIDALSMDSDGITIVLSILDSWDWRNENGHLFALQEKINTYFNFVESGQIYDSFPEAISCPFRLEIVGKFELSKAGKRFLRTVEEAASQLNMTVTHWVH